MNLSTRQAGHWQHELDIEIPVEEVEARLDEVARKFQQRAALPGFRRGRVPLEMVRSHFAEHVEQDFLETFVPQIAGDAVGEARLNPAIPPLVHDLRFTPGQPLRFKVLVDVRPEVEARDYKGLPLSRVVRHVDEEAVGRVLDGLREDTAVFEDLDRPAERGDVVLLDSTRLDANGRRMPATRQKGLRVQLGAPAMLPDLENGLLGATEGQERTIEIGYPEDYPNPDLAGRRHRYVVRVRKIQAKKLRELDDNLARDVFKLESLEELRSRVRLNLEGEERLRVQREAEAAIVEELVRRNEFPLPERLEAYMLERVIREAVGERAVDERLVKELEERYRPGVQRSLRREVLLAAIARQESLSVGDEDVAREIDRMAQADPRQAARVRARYQTAERREALKESLLERRALEWLIEKADVTEEAVGGTPVVVPAGR